VIGIEGDSQCAERRSIRAESRVRILEAIAKARFWIEELTAGEVTSTSEIAVRETCSERSVRMLLTLAWLSPKIVGAVVEGTLARAAGVTRLTNLPAGWTEQHQSLVAL
jgi:hypothetical protein